MDTGGVSQGLYGHRRVSQGLYGHRRGKSGGKSGAVWTQEG